MRTGMRARARAAGFHDVVPHSVLHGGGGGQLRAIDLELLISGLPLISLDDWKAHTAGALARDPAHAELAAWFDEAA